MARFRTSPKKKSVIWRKLTGFTHGLYHAIGKSPLGQALTAYRSVDTSLHHDRRRTLREDCRPMSPARLAMMEAVRESVLMRLCATLFSKMAHLPVSYFGLFFLFYSVSAGLTHAIEAIVFPDVFLSIPRLLLFMAIAIAMIPLMISKKSALQLLSTGKLTQWFFVRLLGVLEEQAMHGAREASQRKKSRMFLRIWILLAFLAGVATRWVHPLGLPISMMLIYLGGMLIAFPEMGVVLSVSLLPLLWWNEMACFVTATTILLTWIGYGVKLLFLHRTLRFNLLDVMVLIFSVTVTLAGITGHYVTSLSVLQGILIFLHLSLYFLVTNLMHTRERMRRCFFGPMLTLALVIVISLASALSQELLNWMQGSIGGDALSHDYTVVHAWLSNMTYSLNACVLLMAIPFICAVFFKKKTVLGYTFNFMLLLLCFVCLYLMGAKTAMVIAFACVVLFFLLLSPRCMAFGILSIPLLLCGGVWLYPAFEDRLYMFLGEMTQSQMQRQAVWKGIWRAFGDFPAGIGLGDHAFHSVYPLYAEAGAVAVSDTQSLYLSLLLKVGLPGFLAFWVMAFVFVQKTFTCIKVSERREDTAMMLGGMLSILGLMGYGLFFSDPASLQICYAAVIVMSLCGAHQNMIFAEWDKITVSMTCGDQSTDVMVHPSGM